VVFYIRGTQIQERAAVIGSLYELKTFTDGDQHACSLTLNLKRAVVRDDPTLANAVSCGTALICFGGRKRTEAKQTIALDAAVAGGIEALLFATGPHFEITGRDKGMDLGCLPFRWCRLY